MEKKKGRVAASLEKSDPAPAAAVPGAVEEIADLPWKLTWCVLGFLFLSLVWYPVSKISAHYPFFSNEGFNTYFEAAAAAGGKIYGNPPVYTYANYPPVSFHLIGWLSAVTHDVNVTGRWVSFFAYLAIGGLIALIVERLSRSWRYAVYSGLCWLIWMPAFDVGRVGMNDPHLLGVAFKPGGVVLLRARPRIDALAVHFGRRVCDQSVHQAEPGRVSRRSRHPTSVDFPKAICDLAGHGRRGVRDPVGADAGRGWQVLLRPSDDAARLLRFRPLGEPGVVSVLRAGRFRGGAHLGVPCHQYCFQRFSAVGISHCRVAGAFYCGGAGAGVNHFFDAMILTAMIAGLALPGLQQAAEGSRFPRAALTFVLIVPFFLTSMVVLTRRLSADLGHNAQRDRTGRGRIRRRQQFYQDAARAGALRDPALVLRRWQTFGL